MIAVFMQVTQPATGVSFMQGYGVYFFEIAGSTQPFQDGIIVNCAGLAGVLISIGMMRRFRRRPILFIGSAGVGLSIFLTALVYTVNPTADWSKKCVVAFIVIYVFFYFLVYSPYPFLISGEVPSQSTVQRFRANFQDFVITRLVLEAPCRISDHGLSALQLRISRSGL